VGFLESLLKNFQTSMISVLLNINGMIQGVRAMGTPMLIEEFSSASRNRKFSFGLRR
jgi:hypothetical protein